MANIDLQKDGWELVHYDEAGIPLYIRVGSILFFPEGKVLPHWHEDLEFACLLEGNMGYDINGKQVVVHEGECIFINASQIHFNYSLDGGDCRYICVLFHPSLIAGNPLIYERIFKQAVLNKGIEYLIYDRRNKGYEEIHSLLGSLPALKKRKGKLYELDVLNAICQLWKIVYADLEPLLETRNEQQDPDILIQQEMIRYIYTHYSEPVNLDEIASSAHVSRSKACRIFKTCIGMSPVAFLNQYRLKVSADMLINTEQNVSDIAMRCGFSSFSYFTKSFHQHYKMTPREYRITNKK